MDRVERPLLLFTMGDVAGVGPEIIARAWPDLLDHCCPVVVGNRDWLQRALQLTQQSATIQVIDEPRQAQPTRSVIPLLHQTTPGLAQVEPCRVSAAAGQAAYDFLIRAIDLTLAGQADGIVTAPLHKEGLHGAGLPYPGHTEILAERCGVRDFAMLLSVENLTVAHVTLHMALREVFQHITSESVLEKTRLLHDLLLRLQQRPPRIGVAALNPHASDGGLFGVEEEQIIRPAVEKARLEGIDASGPWPSDTLFNRARAGAFDGIVAMYHDQGHIALKLLGGFQAVNISAGLPLVRTSVAHGTAYDIAWQGKADPASLIAAARVAARLASSEQRVSAAGKLPVAALLR